MVSKNIAPALLPDGDLCRNLWSMQTLSIHVCIIINGHFGINPDKRGGGILNAILALLALRAQIGAQKQQKSRSCPKKPEKSFSKLLEYQSRSFCDTYSCWLCISLRFSVLSSLTFLIMCKLSLCQISLNTLKVKQKIYIYHSDS